MEFPENTGFPERSKEPVRNPAPDPNRCKVRVTYLIYVPKQDNE
ncbi:Uncharacterised protein [Mycobacterium tuberculosis]|nr:Uncharacterised protein [Mycobacterium tuberculosis]